MLELVKLVTFLQNLVKMDNTCKKKYIIKNHQTWENLGKSWQIWMTLLETDKNLVKMVQII
jgi:hypothetical protein